MEAYYNGVFNVSFLSELLVVKENTLRTWLSRHFSDRGTKSETGRVSYSYRDAMELRVFTELVQNFSLTPDAARTATTLCSLRNAELFKLRHKGGSSPERLYFSFRKIDQYDLAFELLEFEQFVEHMHNNNEDTLIIIPVDNLFHSTIAKINIIMESLPEVGSVEEKKPMTKDEIAARYKEVRSR